MGGCTQHGDALAQCLGVFTAAVLKRLPFENDTTIIMESSRPPPPTRSRRQAAPQNAQTAPTLTHQPQQLWQLAPVYHDGGYAINVLQPYGWQQAPSGQGRPHQAPRGKKKRQNKRRHSNQHEADTGIPSLSSLRKENRAKARKYFSQGVACARDHHNYMLSHLIGGCLAQANSGSTHRHRYQERHHAQCHAHPKTQQPT